MTKLLLPLSIFILTCTHSLAEAPNKTQSDHSTELANAMVNTAAIINSIPDIIFYKDIDGVYRGGNQAWADLLGKPLDELIGKTDLELFPEDLAKFFRTKDQEMLTSKATKRNEEWVSNANGDNVLLDTVKTPWVDQNGNTLGILGICRDITPKSNNEREVRAANDQFYAALNAMFTGELAPMNAIWSHSDDISNQGPFGARMDGWEAVGAQFKKEAAMKLGGRITCKNLIVHAGRDIAYTVCVEVGENMSAAGKPVEVSHRATNIFRREEGQWRLIHHHTDLSPQLDNAGNE